MEVRRDIQKIIKGLWRSGCMAFLYMLISASLFAQGGIKKYTVSKGNMQIELSKNLNEKDVDAFVKEYNLDELALKMLLHSNFQDSIKNHGWKIEINNKELLVITKPLFSADDFDDPAVRIRITGIDVFSEGKDMIPASNQTFGSNAFRNKAAFTIQDSVVIFFLRNNNNAKKVFLAGDFTNWQNRSLTMIHTDSGWSIPVKLRPGKYLYKFIVDGNWITDPDNTAAENDDEGNTNSVYYFTNTILQLKGFTNAKKVFVAGSFNNWQEKKLWMNRTPTGWQLPLYLGTGTYTYRYVVDGKWMEDPGNPDHFPNEFGEFNSVIYKGNPTLFTVSGYQNAQKVFLAGSFNQWHNYELAMTRTDSGWQIPYVLGAGNYEYKFYVDGHWTNASGKQLKDNLPGSVLVIEPNYTFHLKGNENAKNVFLAGDFNGWSPNAYAMKKEGDEWVMRVHLSPGKHLYKFVADGKWMRDMGNELWEKNEFGNENSVLWVK